MLWKAFFRAPSAHGYATSRRSTVIESACGIQKRFNSHVVQSNRAFRMAVIGSGPAGFYTAYKVMSIIPHAKIDMYENLPVPFGLVRFGVAPDHPEVKNCQEKFTEVASSPNFTFIGNVEVGKDIRLNTLKGHYHAIVYAYGASQDRKLGIPGEDTLKGVHSARNFVGWYNGLPEHADLGPDLSTGDTAVIIGQGNVALDVARTLLTDIDVLRKTDMTDNALDALAKSKVKRVHVVGRRGPMQAAFTIKEVRELMNLPKVSFDPIDVGLLPPLKTKLARTPKRMVTLLKDGTKDKAQYTEKSWTLDFMMSPCRFAGGVDSTGLKQVDFQKTHFRNQVDRFEPSAKIEPLEGEVTSIPTSLAFRSIGYKSIPIEGMQDLLIHFDRRKGIISNDPHGRLVKCSNSADGDDKELSYEDPLAGLYCAGWVKRGPAGVIANTMEDSFATAEAIARDWESNRPFMIGGEGWDVLSRGDSMRHLRPVSWNDWLKIDAVEKSRGKLKGKQRQKFTTVPEMLSVLD